MMVIPGTYYGQWMSGLRHGFGVRQSAPFTNASPVRHDDQRLQQLGAAGRRPHHNSMPVLNSSMSSPPVNTSPTSPADNGVFDRGRSGFVLTGDRERDAASTQRTARSRSSSVRRTIAQSFSSINIRKRKSHHAKTAEEAAAQVNFCVEFFLTRSFPLGLVFVCFCAFVGD